LSVVATMWVAAERKAVLPYSVPLLQQE